MKIKRVAIPVSCISDVSERCKSSVVYANDTNKGCISDVSERCKMRVKRVAIPVMLHLGCE